MHRLLLYAVLPVLALAGSGVVPVAAQAPDSLQVEQLQEEVHALENVSIQDTTAELIKRALAKHGGRRKAAAQDLGISERTLYRKIRELGL